MQKLLVFDNQLITLCIKMDIWGILLMLKG
jgi:hypothetical protein